jgi:hypothetical protein
MILLKKCKYIGKLRLLERGLVAAATSLDKLNPVVKQRAPGVEEDDTDEAEAEFIQRINLFVAVSLRQAGDSNRDDYKNGLAYQMRKQTIADFLKSAYLKKCANCLAYVKDVSTIYSMLICFAILVTHIHSAKKGTQK